MQVIRGGLHRPKRKNVMRRALAISALALAFPATAFGAQKGADHTATSANGELSRPAGLGGTVLAFGSGYNSPDGSPQVQALQRHLELAGYSPRGIDGFFGPWTRQAVVAFQTSHGLEVDGIVGPRTWAALSAPVLILGPGAGDQPGGSDAVRSLQRRLSSAGDSPGPIDGRYGVLTEGAVRRFQRSHRLQATGLADPRVLALLSNPARSNGRSNPVPQSPAPSIHRQSTRSRPPAVNPTSALPERPLANAAKARPHSSHRPSSGTWSWMTILVGLALALALVLGAPVLVTRLRYARRRDSDETPVATTSNGEASPAALEQTVAVTSNGHHKAVARTNGNQVHTNGYRPEGNAGNGGNGGRGYGGDGAEKRPSLKEEMDLAETVEAAGAFKLGLLLEAQGRLAEARAAYGRAEERGHGTAVSNLGRLLEQQGALAEAEAAYRRADERGDGAGALYLGMLLEEQGALDEAAAAYGRASDRGNGPAASYLGVMLVERGALGESEAAFRRGDECGDATASFNLGVILEERGALSEAEEAYRRAERCGEEEIASVARAAMLDLQGGLQGAGVGRRAGGDDA
jgi:peptidoglycan hydrolase-like protein with peptidoglycan-binding domain